MLSDTVRMLPAGSSVAVPESLPVNAVVLTLQSFLLQQDGASRAQRELPGLLEVWAGGNLRPHHHHILPTLAVPTKNYSFSLTCCYSILNSRADVGEHLNMIDFYCLEKVSSVCCGKE